MMVYVELQLDGKVRIYQITDMRLLHKVQIETAASYLPVPETMAEAHDYLRANCFQFEMFDTFAHMANWAEHYGGFRAGEVRAELARLEERRAGRVADLEFVAA